MLIGCFVLRLSGIPLIPFPASPRGWTRVWLRPPAVRPSNEVPNFHIAPLGAQILGHEPPVTTIRRVLAAQQDGVGYQFARHGVLDLPRPHQRQELSLIDGPAEVLLSIAIEHFLSRREIRNRDVVHVGDLAQEESQVVPLRESGKLRHIVEAHREVFGALAGDLNRVVFTLHSAQADQHDAITRVPGSHGGAIEAIQRSVDAGIPTEFHFVPMEQPASELRLLFELAANLGVQTIRVIRFVPHGRGRRETALRPTATALRELKSALDELRRDGRVTLRVGPAFRFLVDYAPFCAAGIEELVVSSNGDVYPCSGFLGYDGPEAVGNVSASTLEDVWTSAPFVCATRNLINDRLANRAMHRVGCPAQKAFVAGRITDDIPDPDLLGRVG
jgi:hypothetical protein